VGYSIQLKEAVLQKVLSGSKPQYEIAKEFGVGKSTIRNWLKKYRNNGNISLESKEKRPKDWTSEERLTALITTGAMTPEECASWCRKKGIFPHHLEQWKKAAISSIAAGSGKKQSDTERQLRKENSALKKDLSRKEKALAETAALLVLKKKAQAIWGEPEED